MEKRSSSRIQMSSFHAPVRQICFLAECKNNHEVEVCDTLTLLHRPTPNFFNTAESKAAVGLLSFKSHIHHDSLRIIENENWTILNDRL